MSFSKLVEAVMKNGEVALSEKSPPGFKGTVKAMKKHDDIDNPYALGWWMKKKGYKSHKKADGTEKESVGNIRVEHAVHGTGIVESIDEKQIAISWDNLEKRVSAPSSIPFAHAKYLTVLGEGYSSDPKDAEVKKREKKAKMKKKDKVDESIVGIAPVKGTMRGGNDLEDMGLDILTIDDLLEGDDEWKKPWEDDDRDENRDEDGDHGLRDAENTRQYKGADYTNVPRPSDSVLTNQEDQPEYHADPLATHAGFDAAGDGDEPDGDYGEDLLPVDAPDAPEVRDLEGSSTRHNTRDAGEGEDTSEVDAGDYDESKPEDTEGEKMKKNESAWLTAEDLGLDLTENDMGMDYDMNEHDMGSGEVAFTCEFLEKMLNACSSQSPDESKVKALCDGLKAAQQEKGDMALDVSDWDSVKSHAASAYSGGGDEMGDADYSGPEGDMDYEAGADEFGGMGDEDDVETEEACGEYEDKAKGDGEPAGPEGGREHEGKTKMMDRTGMSEKKLRPGEYNDDDQDRRVQGRDRKTQQSMRRQKPRRSKSYEGSRGENADYIDEPEEKSAMRKAMKKGKSFAKAAEIGRKANEGKGGSSGTPIGTGNTSGSGGGGQKDLSKPKQYKGKPVGTGTAGPGGSSADEFGQKPSDRGGSNNVPEYDSGSQHGAADNPFSKGSPNPRNTKPLAAESKKAKGNKKKLDEAIMLGMSGIPSTDRGRDLNVPEDVDWDDEILAMRRRAGYENWWEKG